MVTLFEQTQPSKSEKPEKNIADAQVAPSNLPSSLSRFTINFFRHLALHQAKNATTSDQTIKVSEVLGTIALLYEKIRNVVEYKGEHVIRRNAIERILKRLLWERSTSDPNRIASNLLRELIWARYLPNDSVPKSKTHQIAKIISKYITLLNLLLAKETFTSDSDIKNWIWGVASAEIEEALDPSFREPYVEFMYEWFTNNFDWQNVNLTNHEKQLQIYLAIHRALAKSDIEIMRYHLLVKEVPDWPEANEITTRNISDNFFKLHQEIEKHINFPEATLLYRVIQKQIAPFEVFRALVNQEASDVEAILKDREKFDIKVREICQRKYKQIQSKVNTGIIRSILYIFITKVIFALLIEIPYEAWVFGHIRYLPIGINVIIPPSMMFLIGMTIRAPGDKNTVRILEKLHQIVYSTPLASKSKFSLVRSKPGRILGRLFATTYLILFILVFGGITYLLLLLDFSWVGVGVFFAFLSLVLLFGFRVRYAATELRVTSDKESIFEYLFNHLTLPFLSTGVVLSRGLAKLNVFTLILDFLIETPLKTIIEIIEEWTSFMREKREEVVEVPDQ